jgi:hypothetical protein
MKKIVQTLIITACLAAPAAWSQGFVGFANNPTRPILDGATGAAATGAAGYTVGLYWSRDVSGDYTLAATAPIVNAGVFNNGGLPVGIEGTNPSDVVFVQIKAWTGGFASYEDALANGSSADYAGSSLPTNPITLAAPGSPAPNLVIQGGLQGFTTEPIPEPSTIAFGILGGIGAMVLLRRRK